MGTPFTIEMNGIYDVGGFTGPLGAPGVGGHAAKPEWYNRFGMDLGADADTTVFAAFDGHITKLNRPAPGTEGPSSYGVQLFMRSHNNKMGAYYTHFDEVPAGIGVGSHIARGDVLGSVVKKAGVGPHIHMALVEIVGALNPANYRGVDSLYTLMQGISVRDTVKVSFAQDGSTQPWVL
ncbi:peptidoglycan DD-metalloendopeptidase family protein [Mycolicibacterium sp.]|uniref:peptidoglycan DD-metalloendopeptidase family protein n=1 Tax=Mycolicibacterium sp. TaxID=2320850 RepID=UPI0037CB6BB2